MGISKEPLTEAELYERLWQEVPEPCRPTNWQPERGTAGVDFCGQMALLILVTVQKTLRGQYTEDDAIANIASDACDECPLGSQAGKNLSTI